MVEALELVSTDIRSTCMNWPTSTRGTVMVAWPVPSSLAVNGSVRKSTGTRTLARVPGLTWAALRAAWEWAARTALEPMGTAQAALTARPGAAEEGVGELLHEGQGGRVEIDLASALGGALEFGDALLLVPYLGQQVVEGQ